MYTIHVVGGKKFGTFGSKEKAEKCLEKKGWKYDNDTRVWYLTSDHDDGIISRGHVVVIDNPAKAKELWSKKL